MERCPTCQRPDGGFQICCDNHTCNKWFHGKCVGQFVNKKKSKWHCPLCSGHWTGIWFKPKKVAVKTSAIDTFQPPLQGSQRPSKVCSTSPFKVTRLSNNLAPSPKTSTKTSFQPPLHGSQKTQEVCSKRPLEVCSTSPFKAVSVTAVSPSKRSRLSPSVHNAEKHKRSLFTDEPSSVTSLNTASASCTTLIAKINNVTASTVDTSTSPIAPSGGAASNTDSNDKIVAVKTSAIDTFQPPLQGSQRPSEVCSTSPFKVTRLSNNLAPPKTTTETSIQPPFHDRKKTLEVCSTTQFKAVSMTVSPSKRGRLSLSVNGDKHKPILCSDNPPSVTSLNTASASCTTLIAKINNVTASTVDTSTSPIAPSGGAASNTDSNDKIVLDYFSPHAESMEEDSDSNMSDCFVPKKKNSKVNIGSLSKSVNTGSKSSPADWNVSGIDTNAEKQLKSLLPAEFHHLIEAVQPYSKLNSAITAVVRLPLTTKEEALDWLDHFQASSFTDFRSLKTWPNVTKDKVLFKKQFRCHHNTLPNYKKSKKHHAKHVGCPARVMVTLKNRDMTRTRVASCKNWLCPFLINCVFMFLPAELIMRYKILIRH